MKLRRQRALRARWLGWLLAGLFLAVGPAAIWHDTTTLHAVCPQHGEILDVASPSGVHESSDEGLRWSAAEEGHGDHQECPFLTLGQPSSPAPQPRLVGRLLESPDPCRVPCCEVRRVSIPILLQAPKQSPPV